MNRRHAMLALAALGAAPRVSLAQQPRKLWRIGFISSTSQPNGQGDLDAIVRGLRALGYVEGSDFTFESRWVGGNIDLQAGFVAELVRLELDLIVTRSTPTAIAVKAATRSIPVIFTNVSDPVSSGVVGSLARPGGNLTGWTNMFSDTSGKLLELLKAMAPGISRAAVLSDPGNPGKVLEVNVLQQAAKRLGLPLQARGVRSAADVDAAFAQMLRDRTDALIVLVDGVTATNRQRIVELTAKQRLPAIYEIREFVDGGGLMSYGMNMSRQYERTAEFMHRIFKGAKPADLPVEQPTQFELVINRKTAKALGLAIPPLLLQRADEVIQ